MSTGQQHHNEKNVLSFESINHHINDYVNDSMDEHEALNPDGEGAVASPQTPAASVQHLLTTYAGVRPILVALAKVGLLPEAWRSTLSRFVDALDTVTATFKAGKDLAVGNGGSTVEMEPKLPVG